MPLSLVSRRIRSLVLRLLLLASASAAFAVAPVVTTQPGVVTATSGQNATFTVAASGSGGQTYQWRHLGAPIFGAIADSLTLPSVTMADAGFYDVVVTDGAESTIS